MNHIASRNMVSSDVSPVESERRSRNQNQGLRRRKKEKQEKDDEGWKEGMGAGGSEECGNGDGGALPNAAIADLHEKECKKEVKHREGRGLERRFVSPPSSSFSLSLSLYVYLYLYSVCVFYMYSKYSKRILSILHVF